jgi:threonine synthase
MDPHTAVAAHVLEQYRNETGDTAVTLVASTASPFKFCNSVLDALGVTDQEEGLAILEQLSRRTGAAVPAPLAALTGKSIRFTQCVAKSNMVSAVLGMLPEKR